MTLYDYLNRYGWEDEVVAVNGSGSNHIVTLFTKKGRVFLINLKEELAYPKEIGLWEDSDG